MNFYSHGICVKAGITNGNKITNQALWQPLYCQPPGTFSVQEKEVCIEDPIIPVQTLQVVNVYSIEK